MTWLNFLLTSLLFEAISFVRETEQAQSFISTPSSPLHPMENDNITLRWTYTLDGSPLDQVEVTFYPDSPSLSARRVARYKSGGTTEVAIDFQDRFVFNLTDSQSTITILRSQRSDSGTYELIVVPDAFAATTIRDDVKISVKYAAKINFTSGNQTLNENDTFNLTCVADGNPTADYNWTRVSNNKAVSFPLIINGKQDEGGYRCTASNDVGSPDSRIVYVFVQSYHPINTIMTTNLTNNTIRVNKTFSISCSAQANPPAKYRFYKGDEYINGTDNDSVIITSVTERVKMVNYSCIPFNFYGSGTKNATAVTVHYPPVIGKPENVTENVTVGQEVHLPCSGEGYPTPTIFLTAIYFNGSRQNHSSGDSNLTMAADSPLLFQCTVHNYVETRTKWFHLVLNARKIEIAITIVNKACRDNPDEKIKQLQEFVTDDLKKRHIPVEKVESLTFRCGSITGYFSLIFSQNVEIENVLTILKEAAEDKSFGDLVVDPKSIQAISPERIPTTTTPTPTPTPTPMSTQVDEATTGHPPAPKCEGFIPESNCPLSVTFIVVVVVLTVILVFVTFACIIYCLYKRRKCRKDPRVHNSRSEERPCSLSQNDYCQVNNGYAEAGPQSTEVANLDHPQGEEGAAAVPNYAVVVKSKKKDKKKEKKGTEMNPCEDEYAVVDKSKKKTKKNEPDATYAEVDLLKKSKKPKPGEVLYADLGEFHHMKKMPEISTSPKTLPPIKRPEPYAETQYADISQFIKGNPEDAGAEPPKDSTTTAVGKEESLAGNTGDGAEGTNETGF